MKRTYKIKFLDCDVKAMQEKLNDIDKSHGFSDDRISVSLRDYRATVFNGLAPDQEYVRVQDEDHRVNIKIVQNDKVTEHEVIRSSYKDIVALLEVLGFMQKMVEEERRFYYTLPGTVMVIHCWPRIPAYIQIETESKEELSKVCTFLELNPEEAFNGDLHSIFIHYGIDINNIDNLVFAEGQRPLL
jgi:adenylate cyclase, class 2